ncbi:LpxI family protein [Loktanella sp. D2R18]|uniref:LpxI family protein n=1 Tax=Rhodobacterales TaxID=204455 RepID=UPI000DEB09BD|nr:MULTISPECIES: UDP-2,3-diacylglucosamine diphosphatase LpxI [Rhodobacterales]MDO6589567.1 UDP-2,3-diacylglucosamine diphosphatase LpxI [Yoonia sp. 1_MG-2023]RBW44208.1 LpxI family protein [Loktanella sp. D2R18]
MLALIAGTGDLPPALVGRLAEPPLICAMRGFEPSLNPDITFRMEHLGSFLADLRARGVTQICMAGAVRRPQIDPSQIDAATMPLVPKVQAALTQGDDGALRIIIAIMEEYGFHVMAAHEIAPDLLPQPGVRTKIGPASDHTNDAFAGESCVVAMGLADTGQACVVLNGDVVAREDAQGTDAMLQKLCAPNYENSKSFDWATDISTDLRKMVKSWLADKPDTTIDATGGILFKAPKPSQDQRADLPLIGLRTVMMAAEAGLDGIVIEAGGVMVLDLPTVRKVLDAQGMFLWVRPRGGA